MLYCFHLPPGSSQLAQAVIDVFKDTQTQLAILKNHGVVTVGKDFNDAIQRAVFFEMACQILQINPNAKPLDSHTVKQIYDSGKA